MLELQHIRFAGWALTEGQHRPKAGKKKKDLQSRPFFSGSRFVLDVPSGSGLTDFSPTVISIVHPNFNEFSSMQLNGAGRIARAGQNFWLIVGAGS